MSSAQAQLEAYSEHEKKHKNNLNTPVVSGKGKGMGSPGGFLMRFLTAHGIAY